jgi:acetyl esterase/lipase
MNKIKFAFIILALTTSCEINETNKKGESNSAKNNMENSEKTESDMTFDRVEVIYGRTLGTALTMDIFTPKKGVNGAAVVLPLSEGWYSEHAMIDPMIPVYIEPLLDRGYTVFTAIHGSNPKFSILENIEQIHRCIRFIRHHANKYGIDSDRIGMTGDSAGGHLSLMLGCSGNDGNLQAEDSVDRESSKIQAAVAFFPPTDFLNWGQKGEIMLGNHPIVPLTGAFDFQKLNDETNAFESVTDLEERKRIGREISPINHVTKNCVPTLIVYGDKDDYIPPQQSTIMIEKLKKFGVPSKIIVQKDGGHDELTIRAHINDAIDWFDKYLKRPK